MLGANNVFYVASNFKNGVDYTDTTGVLHAYNFSNGRSLWHHFFSIGAHAAPAVGRLGPASSGFSVVVGIGDNTGIVPAATVGLPYSAMRLLNKASIWLGSWS